MARVSKKRTSRVVGKVEDKVGKVDVSDFLRENKDEILKVLSEEENIKFVDQKEYERAVSKASESTVQRAARELGVDLDKSVVEAGEGVFVNDMPFLVRGTAKQIDVLHSSTAWNGKITAKDKMALYAIRVFCRQLLGEKAPKGQASTIAELLSSGHTVPTGLFNTRSRYRVTQKHYQAAGVFGDKKPELE